MSQIRIKEMDLKQKELELQNKPKIDPSMINTKGLEAYFLVSESKAKIAMKKE